MKNSLSSIVKLRKLSFFELKFVMCYEVIHYSNETIYRGNRVWFGWSHLRLSFPFLIEVCDMTKIGVASWSYVMNALKENISGIGIPTFGNMSLARKFQFYLNTFVVVIINMVYNSLFQVRWRWKIISNNFTVETI